MEEIPGLAHLRANSEVIEEVNNDEELVITTFAHYDSGMLNKMASFGWVIRAPNVFAWIKPTYNEENEEEEVIEIVPGETNEQSPPFLNEDEN